MITQMRLQNFRGFEDHSLPFGPMTVIVGQNNAGKTTIVEALRLLSIVTLRYKNLPFDYPSSNANIRRQIGVSPSLKNVEINFKTLFNRYSDPPAIITAAFDDRASVTIFVVGDQRIHAVVTDPSGKVVRTRQRAADVSLPVVQIMPQVAPLQRNEVILSPDYVRSAMSSRLAPLHFRNQLNLHYDLFPRFARLVEDTWPSVRVTELLGRGKLPGEELNLEVRNEDFVAEVAEMGHGLQMWLQTMWFLILAESAGTADTVILDEPDVYMHADLQRRVTRLLRGRHPQTIMTTHSVEIMSEVHPDEILVVDKKRKASSFAGSFPAVQAAVNRFGSVHNVHLTRLLGARKFILVEGADLQLLKEFHDVLYPDTAAPLLSLPSMSIGGWTGWKFAIGSSMAFHNALGEQIQTYCILDSDYHTPEEINSRYDEARNREVELHIWQRKEIESYLLCPAAIARFIVKAAPKRTSILRADEIKKKMLELSEAIKEGTLDSIANDIFTGKKGLGLAAANRAARHRIRDELDARGNLLWLVSGKQMLSALSTWTKAEVGVSFGATSIAKEMQRSDIPTEVCDVISAIEEGRPFVAVGP